MQSRKDVNIKILKLLEKSIKKYPDTRFQQLLQILDINKPLVRNGLIIGLVDNHHQESEVTYLDVRDAITRLESAEFVERSKKLPRRPKL